MSMNNPFIKIKQITFVYQEHPKSVFSRVFTIYYKSFLGLFRLSKYYDSYSAADNASIKLFNRGDYSKYTIWIPD